MKRIFAAIAAAGTLALAAACGSSTPTADSTTTDRSSSPAPTLVSPSETPSETPTQETTAMGEIWQWALGRDAWTDKDLQTYTRDLGRTWDTDVNVQSEGFKLSLDSSGTVIAVTLFNDEAALGYPGTSTDFLAYKGQLPGGLSWSDTATTLGAEYGAPNQSGGYGLDITFTTVTRDGYRLEIAFTARHQGDLPGSPIHCVTVRRA